MKIKDGFILKEVAGNYIVVPVGDNIVDFTTMITINETGVFLWECLKNEITEQELVLLMVKEYDIDDQTAKKDIEEFLATLKENKIID